MVKRTLLTISLATLLCSTSANAFMAGGDNNFSFGNTLVDAVNQNNIDLVRTAIDQGTDPNQPGKFDTTALQRAAYNGNSEIVALLIANGADVNLSDYGGASALHIAAREGRDNVTKELVQKGANINAQDDQGYTPLHRAVANNKTNVSVFLIAFGADVNTINNEGNSPLIDAVRISNPALVKQLVIKGADKNVRNNKGMDVVDYALKAGNAGIDNILSKSTQQLMQENPVSTTNVVVTNTNPASNIPQHLRQVTPNINATAQQPASFASNNVVKVPVAQISVEDMQPMQVQPVTINDEKPFRRIVQTPQQEIVAEQNATQFEMVDLQLTGDQSLQPVNSEAGLQRAPRLPNSGDLPNSLKQEFTNAQDVRKNYAEAQRLQQEHLKNIKPIDLPANVESIETTSSDSINIAEPLSQPASTYNINNIERADLVDRAPAPIQQETQSQSAKAVYDLPAFMRDRSAETFVAAPANRQEVEVTQMDNLPRVERQITNIEPVKATPKKIKGMPANTYAIADDTTPQATLNTPAQISAPVEQPVEQFEAPAQEVAAEQITPPAMPASLAFATPQQQPIQQVPAEAAYEAEVDSLMDAYVETVDVSQEYETEVDTLMNSLITNMDAPAPTIMKTEELTQIETASQPEAIAPAYPLSLTFKESMIQQTAPAQELTEAPALSAAPVAQYKSESDMIWKEEFTPQSYAAEPAYTSPAYSKPAAVENPVSGADYNSYRANLLSDVNEFFNKDKKSYNPYDISDLEEQRINNLGMGPVDLQKDEPLPQLPFEDISETDNNQ